MTQNILIVIPLQEEYSDLYHSLSALDLKSYVEKIGKLDVHCFPDRWRVISRSAMSLTWKSAAQPIPPTTKRLSCFISI